MNPDFASVNFHEEGATGLAEYFVNRGIGLEAGLSNPQAAEVLIKSGIASRALRALVEPQEQNFEQALETISSIKKVLARARIKLPIVLHGTDSTTSKLLDNAGYDIRVGFEDTLRLPNGETASSNGALIHHARLRIEKLSDVH